MPEPHRHRPIDLLAVGELLVDFISEERGTLAEAQRFVRHQGGSPANLTRNLALLGNRVALIACVGNENLGRFLTDQIQAAGVLTDHLIVDPVAPTSIVVVSRTTGTPDFIAYRDADIVIHPEHIPDDVLARSTLYHTTCFALSREPAQSSILDGAHRAASAGCTLSIDVNYAPSIWNDRAEAQRVVADYCRDGAFVKVSEDDVARLFDEDGIAPDEVIRRFHTWGARLVCLTQGSAGSLVSWQYGRAKAHVAARSMTVADATGAGDAYWAGFLSAWLDGHPPDRCACVGSRLAALKLETVGPLSETIAPETLFEECEAGEDG